jgi:hypothetical protein
LTIFFTPVEHNYSTIWIRFISISLFILVYTMTSESTSNKLWFKIFIKSCFISLDCNCAFCSFDYSISMSISVITNCNSISNLKTRLCPRCCSIIGETITNSSIDASFWNNITILIYLCIINNNFTWFRNEIFGFMPVYIIIMFLLNACAKLFFSHNLSSF